MRHEMFFNESKIYNFLRPQKAVRPKNQINSFHFLKDARSKSDTLIVFNVQKLFKFSIYLRKKKSKWLFFDSKISLILLANLFE